MRFISVDLPDPDGPMMATYSPASIAVDTPRSAWISSSPIRYVFHKSFVSINAMGMNTNPAVRRFPILHPTIRWRSSRARLSALDRRGHRPCNCHSPLAAIRANDDHAIGHDLADDACPHLIARADDAAVDNRSAAATR